MVIALAALAASLSATLLTACGTPQAAVVAELRDAATGAPAAGVGISVTPLDPEHPLRISDYLRADPVPGPGARTGPDGAASIAVPVDHPFAVNVFVPGAGPLPIFFGPLPLPKDPGDWVVVTDPAAQPGGDAHGAAQATLELRLRSRRQAGDRGR